MKKKVLFRADGDAQIGLGHVMRCLALAEMLGDDYNRRFAIVQPAPEVVRLIEEEGVAVLPLASNQVDEFASMLEPDMVVVLDGYAFDQSYQQTVRAGARALVYIDDLVTGHQVADVVVNHAGGLTEYEYQSESYTQFCIGPHYALLRPPFFAPITPTPKEGPVFVSLGGADPSNTTVRVLEGLLAAFRLLNQIWRVHVVVGPLQQNRPAIDALKNNVRHLHILEKLNAGQMVAELTKCQLAITACSTIAYEVCAVNRPLIAIQTADNQSRLAVFLEKNALTPDVLPINATIDQIANALYTGLSADSAGYRELLTQNQRRYFDGRSPERFRALFERLCN
ncbi:UDP-2,4-diacetamido-2,4,6-trideoxy-beta-L-altropyranose hydrolase [Spirosoma montaniterrae]|uniref:UDP-2,4-diacetamido-2,4, 6-trideoxy-beta-L-altropyranose hydrolase n=1 Tax=Spirosoma montaniterrae TaxID=1178516 RepID=A0A1P9WZD9_9BACT|nr:UDP-2,4-diacetamido-2,4,6-trideoxy-beta-L-altropyranose hydrolase [Spirosoma montaniterrae]AQG80739.1 UDP-2,4-diacetamido-2,4,6-trideoxy-beta-L-altropyranose hydrolase [Spirosoma montaniterrae]